MKNRRIRFGQIFFTPRSWLLILLIILSGFTALLFYSMSQTTLLGAQSSLDQFWRSSYDLLVRPANSRSEIESANNLVASNFTSDIRGGITFDQYDVIRSLPGIEIAAPIAVIQNINVDVGVDVSLPNQDLRIPQTPGVYKLITTFEADEGYRQIKKQVELYALVPVNITEAENVLQLEKRLYVSRFLGFYQPSLYHLLVAIDPQQEQALLQLDKSIVSGGYLADATGWSVSSDSTLGGGSSTVYNNIPVLINGTQYTQYAFHRSMEKVILPDEQLDAKKIVDLGGAEYLDQLPTISLAVDGPYNSEELLNLTIESLADKRYQDLHSISNRKYTEYKYIFENNFSGMDVPVVRIEKQFLQPSTMEGSVNSVFADFRLAGVFDLEKIPRPAAINWAPLDTYYPPNAMLKYDENFQPVQPVPVLPSITGETRYQYPAMLITTIKAARVITGDDCISAIRIRVDESIASGPHGQQAIEALATAIVDQTGLDVDIMVGSSSIPVLVHIPGVGYVEEQWIKKGVNLIYRKGLVKANIFLLCLFGAIIFCILFQYIWMDVFNRQNEIALSKALGWRSISVFRYEIGHTVGRAAVASLAACLLFALVCEIFQVEKLSLSVYGGLTGVILLMAVLGGALPAVSASRVRPAILFRGTEPKRMARILPSDSLPHICLNALLRRPWLTLINVMGIALSNALLCCLFLVETVQKGMLNGTVLGQYLLVHLNGWHLAMMAIGFSLSISAIAIYTISRVVLEKREICISLAVGWKKIDVQMVYSVEGAFIGVLGGVFGIVLGLLLFQTFSNLALVGLSTLIWLCVLSIFLPAIASGLAAFLTVRKALRDDVLEGLQSL